MVAIIIKLWLKWSLLKTWINWLLLPLCLFPQQSPEYPNYQYLCKLCSVHIENIQGAHKHIKEKRHKKNIMVWKFKLCAVTRPCILCWRNKGFEFCCLRSGSGVSGKTGGERAARSAARLRHPVEGRGRVRPRNSQAARDLGGGLWGSEGRGRQDGGDHQETPLRLYPVMSLSLVYIYLSELCKKRKCLETH